VQSLELLRGGGVATVHAVPPGDVRRSGGVSVDAQVALNCSNREKSSLCSTASSDKEN
jgi:hypothetical protein